MIFAREALTETLRIELQPLLAAHDAEVGSGLPPDPDWGAYMAAEHFGCLRLYTARAAARLFGYASFFVARHPHHRTSLQALADMLYLDPGHRGRHASGFIAWCDAELAAEGVMIVLHQTTRRRDFGPLLERLGYTDVGTLWERRL